jgi:flagellar motor switch protein FliM
LHPHNAVGSLQMDQSLIFPIVDLLLGGPGKGQSLDREISDIEEEIIESVARIICKELQSAWQPFGLDLQMSERQSVAQLERQFPPTDKVLALSFEVGLAEAKGSLNLVFPSSLCNTILRQASKNWAFRRARGDADSGQRLKQKLLSCKYHAELSLSNLEVRVRDVLALKAGSILRLPLAAKQPAALQIENRSVFEAYPVRVSKKRAAQLGETIQVKTNLRKVK